MFQIKIKNKTKWIGLLKLGKSFYFFCEVVCTNFFFFIIISKLDERFIREASGTKRKLRSFDLIRDSEDDDDDSDENEEEFEEHAFKYVQRGGGRFGGTKKRPHLETSKNFRGGSPHQAEMKKSKKAEKRGRFHHWHNNQNHQRKDFLADQVVHFNHHHNKFH